MMTEQKSIAVYCPFCKASAGEKCTFAGSVRGFWGSVHLERTQLAAKRETQANTEASKVITLKKGEQEANAERHPCRALPSNGGNAA